MFVFCMHTIDALVSSAELSQLPIRLYLQVLIFNRFSLRIILARYVISFIYLELLRREILELSNL